MNEDVLNAPFEERAFDLDKLQKSEISMGGKEWRIVKLLPMEAKMLFIRFILPCFSAVRGVEFHEPPGEDGTLVRRPFPVILMEILGKIPPDKMDAVSEIFMEKCIQYKGENGMWIKASYNTGQAAANLDPAELLLLDVMAFVQNFKESVSKIEKHLFTKMQAPETDQSLQNQ